MTTKLLAVDDSKTMRRVLEIAFSGDEFHLTTAASAQEALAAVGSSSPDVALVDGHLGASSGYDLVREIKAASPRTRVLVLSSKQRPYDEGAGQSAGADGTFEKPFDSTKLLARVAELSSGAPAAAPAPVLQPAAVSAAPVVPPPLAAAPAPVAVRPSAASPVPPSAAPAPAAARSSTAQRPPAPAARASAAPPQIAPLSAPAASAPAPSAPAANGSALLAATGSLATQLAGLGLTREQVEAVLALSRDVVEQVVWEVVPVLAETLIKEEIARLTAD